MSEVDEDLQSLAALSHALAQAAIEEAGHGARAPEVADEVMHGCGGRRDVVALALSYVLRAETDHDGDLTSAIDGVALVLRRLSA